MEKHLIHKELSVFLAELNNLEEKAKYNKEKRKPLTIGFVRVSTPKQNLEQQQASILSYAHNNGLKIDYWVEVMISTKKKKCQQLISTLISKLQENDCIIISELSRIGRTLNNVIKNTYDIINKKAQLISLKDNINITKNTINLHSKIMITFFALIAEIERDLISERTKQALTTAKAKGKKLGRPQKSYKSTKLHGKEYELALLLNRGVNITAISKLFGVTRATVYNFLNRYKVREYAEKLTEIEKNKDIAIQIGGQNEQNKKC